MVDKALFSSTRTDWRTPDHIFEELEAEFGHPLYDVSDTHGGTFDAFKDSWPISVYANPPYGPEIRKWLEEALYQMDPLAKTGGNGITCLAIFLLPARTDTKWFHEAVLPNARQIRFIKGRLKFSGHTNSAPFPSMVVVFSV